MTADARGFPVAEACAIGLLALLVRLANLDHTPFVDEMNHVIAAGSLLREGSLLLDSGAEYLRARHFTWMVAGSMAIFGENLSAARLPSVLAGTLLVVAVFLWVRQAFGRWEGWTAGILLMLAPQAIYHSQLTRFYSFQALYLLGVAWCAWRLVELPSWRSRSAPLLLLGGLVLAWGALSVQFSSLVGLGAIGIWFVGALGFRVIRIGIHRTRPAATVLGFGALLLGAAAWLHLSGFGYRAIGMFDQVDLWADAHRSNFRFYHDHLLSHYPLLWASFPIIALLALRRQPSLSSLWLLVFALVFTVHSVSAWKAERYIFYVLPFFFALTGVVVGPLLRWLLAEFTRGVEGIIGAGSRRIAMGAGVGLLTLSLLFAAWGNSAFPYSARMIGGTDASWPFPVLYRGEADWGAVARELEDEISGADVVVVSTEQKAQYFLGRGELVLSVNYLDQDRSGTPRPEFTRNWKTGTPMIHRPETVDMVVACRRSGLILVERNHWRQAWSVPDLVADRIEELARRVPLAEGWRVVAFEWDHGAGFEARPDECSPLLAPAQAGVAMAAPPSVTGETPSTTRS
ncbi:MAG: hypothetical protein EA350_10190 [Gemmatimonadales bacterium]|nr:MAG: hypothetical protein EA350_10190 [Gemmatimonadales bacterium]